jgi:hypothetical protein
MLKTHTGDRLTVRETVYHQQVGEPASQFDSAYTLPCNTSEEVWDRKLSVGEEWQPLITKHCWVENPGMVVIYNCSGDYVNTQPTEDEIAAEDAKILDVGNDIYQPITLIPAQGNVRFWPIDLASLLIRCRIGETKYKVVVIPE